MPRIDLDAKHCAGHALCNATAPEVYDLDDNGYCLPNSTVIGEALRPAAASGAGACPERALSVRDD
ncbi:ferredoxin [Rhodococcus sp. IEGM 1366]|uniref:ferredoxin n=1 Tax=Rhodococcus sp. IEGM 1366 TaxID=3082223 RepID=UPI002953598B|nr:ferredoxin [Rhodococcus sp. IEGM 1366]MDV8070651.1 ferredoxin [Rhodococcus sp. IEGM 1366]